MGQSVEGTPNWVLGIIAAILSILLGLHIGIRDGKRNVESVNTMPPHPNPSVPMFYDNSTREWRKIYRGSPNQSPSRGMTKDEVQRYLEKKVPGYFEDTYWGEEYEHIKDK